MTTGIPTIDLRHGDAPQLIDEACRTIGFFAIDGHDVPAPVRTSAFASARAFFDLPLEMKKRARAEGNPYGFQPLKHEALARTLDDHDGVSDPDPKQSFNLGPPNRGSDSGFGAYARIWPTEPYQLRLTWLAYYAEMERLASRLLDLFASAMRLPGGFFEPFVDQHVSALRALDYPTYGSSSSTVRAGAHTDYGVLTILAPDPEVSGLEVADRSGGWIEVPPMKDGFVVNIGDLMHRWTNGRWRSTLHRVVGDLHERRRASMAFFHNPNWDAVIEPILLSSDEEPRFEPVMAGPWLAEKVALAT